MICSPIPRRPSLDIVKKRKNPTLFNEIFYKKIIDDGVQLTIEPGWKTKPPVLRVLGDLDKVIHAKITESDIRAKKFSEVTYSLGLGALGSGVKDAMPLMGEMITLYGSMVWLPTDGNNTPDFLTPMDPESDVPVYTGYNITLDGPFNEYFTLETENPQGVSISDIYRAIFSSAHDRVNSYKGVIALTIWGVIDSFSSSGLKKAPVASCGPSRWRVDHVPLADPRMDCLGFRQFPQGRHAHQFRYRDRPDNQPVALPAGDHSPRSTMQIPLNTGAAKQMYLHNHGVVFKNVPYDASLDLNTQVKKIVTDGEFVDMRHLLDSTRLRKAKIGIAYIQDIVKDA